MNVHTDVKSGYLPDGSYLKSCRDLDFYDGNLSGICRMINKDMKFTEIYVPYGFYGDISNCNGDLTLGDCW